MKDAIERIADGTASLDDYYAEIKRVRRIFQRARRQANKEQEQLALQRLVKLNRLADDLNSTK